MLDRCAASDGYVYLEQVEHLTWSLPPPLSVSITLLHLIIGITPPLILRGRRDNALNAY